MAEMKKVQTEVKLTKKQKKALQFREAKKNKNKSNETNTDDSKTQEANVLEYQGNDSPSNENSEKSNKKHQKTKDVKKPKAPKNESSATKGNTTNPKKRKSPSDENTESNNAQATSNKEKKDSNKKARYIVFVGNLPFDASEDDIKQHFISCGNPIVRLRKDKGTNKSKGFAFVEFDSSISLSKALHLHQSTLKYRKINVEITAGGGGASEQRKKKIADRNAKLNKEREKFEKKNHGQSKASGTDDLDFSSGPAVNSERLKLIKNLNRKSKY